MEGSMAAPDTQTVIAIITIAASAGAAWAGVRQALNGTRETVKNIAAALDTQGKTFAEHVQADHEIQVEAVRVSTRIEAKVDGIIETREERDRLVHSKLDSLLRK
jgi:phosphoribosylformylglycinamidine (FGAM) synthase PurS component